MSTWEEAEAYAWWVKEQKLRYAENETIWSVWKSAVIILPKKSIYGKRVWGFDAYKRTNENKRVEYATKIELFKHKLSTP